MIMADVLKIFLIVVGILLVLVCYWLAAESLFPRLVRCSQVYYRHRPVTTTLVGILLVAPFILVGGGLFNAGGGPAQGVGFLVLAVPVLLALLGSAGLARQLGEGLPSAADTAAPWRPVMRGGAILALSFLLPFVGWFLVFPAVLVTGVGAATRGWWQARRERLSEEDSGR